MTIEMTVKRISLDSGHYSYRQLSWVVIMAACLAFAAPSSAQDTVQTLTVTRTPVAGSPPVTQSFIVTAVPTPTAVVILLTGGDGTFDLIPNGSDGTVHVNSANFLIRSRWLFAGKGLYTISLDAATDFKLLPNVLKGQQGSAAHVTDLLQVIAWARTTVPSTPVWIIGTSRGTGGAFVAAQYSPAAGGPDGLVFADSVSGPSDPDSLDAAALTLSNITVPVLFLQDNGNSCPGTEAVPQAVVVAGLTSSSKVSTESVPSSGLTALTDPCDGLSDHGFFGETDGAVPDIALWIASAP